MEQALVFMLGAVMILAGVAWFAVRGVVRAIAAPFARPIIAVERPVAFERRPINSALRPFAILGGLMLLYIVGRSIGL